MNQYTRDFFTYNISGVQYKNGSLICSFLCIFDAKYKPNNDKPWFTGKVPDGYGDLLRDILAHNLNIVDGLYQCFHLFVNMI